MYEPWRCLTTETRRDMMESIIRQMLDKYEAGRAEHGDTFQGDPIQHAMEEMVDGVFYVQVLKRKVGYLEKRLTRASEFIRCCHEEGLDLYCPMCGAALTEGMCGECGPIGEEGFNRVCVVCGLTFLYDGSLDW